MLEQVHDLVDGCAGLLGDAARWSRGVFVMRGPAYCGIRVGGFWRADWEEWGVVVCRESSLAT